MKQFSKMLCCFVACVLAICCGCKDKPRSANTSSIVAKKPMALPASCGTDCNTYSDSCLDSIMRYHRINPQDLPMRLAQIFKHKNFEWTNSQATGFWDIIQSQHPGCSDEVCINPDADFAIQVYRSAKVSYAAVLFTAINRVPPEGITLYHVGSKEACCKEDVLFSIYRNGTLSFYDLSNSEPPCK